MDSEARLTPHALARFRQRGFRLDDGELVSWLGRPVEGGVMVCRKDAERVAEELRRLADRCERLADARLVIEGDAIITAYRPGRRKSRNLLRHAKERDLEGDWV